MTVNATPPRVIHVTNGIQDTFAFAFRVLEGDDIQVFLNESFIPESPATYTVNLSVGPPVGQDGGDVVMNVPPAAGTLTITRATTLLVIPDYDEGKFLQWSVLATDGLPNRLVNSAVDASGLQQLVDDAEAAALAAAASAAAAAASEAAAAASAASAAADAASASADAAAAAADAAAAAASWLARATRRHRLVRQRLRQLQLWCPKAMLQRRRPTLPPRQVMPRHPKPTPLRALRLQLRLRRSLRSSM
jgi:hypothetical protein